jgi:hypothetical protein
MFYFLDILDKITADRRYFFTLIFVDKPIDQHALKNINIFWNSKFSFYLEISGGHNSNPHLYVIDFFNTSVN